MTDNYEKAILAGGCFWGMQDLIRRRPGVITTRVGYTGGDVPNATYRRHGSHAEAIEISFDPAQTSYRELLEFFFQVHDPSTKNRRCRRFGPVARQSRDRGRGGRPVLGSRARTPGLSRALPQRLHLPLRSSGLGVAPPTRDPVFHQLSGMRSPCRGQSEQVTIALLLRGYTRDKAVVDRPGFNVVLDSRSVAGV
jgi:hypothetical protein